MIYIPTKWKTVEQIKKLENVSFYEFSSNFNIFESTFHSRFNLPLFPKVTDIKIANLERELNQISRFNFSKDFVGFFEVGYENNGNLKFFDSKDYDFFSQAFVREDFYKKNKEYLDSEGAFNDEFEIDSSGGILPSIYFMNSDNGVGKIFIKNYIRKNILDNKKYERGINVKIGLSPRKDGEEILDSLKSKIISLYGEEHQRVDLNN